MTRAAPATACEPQLVTTVAELRSAVARARRAGRSIGLVPTMGALHAGHLSLVDAARREGDFTVVTIFVNPVQFSPHEDFSRYPRTLAADLESLSQVGADLVFAPPTEEVYGPRHATFVEMHGVAEPLEGRCRPGHFRGVATVVLKLFNMVEPDRAYFGQKDYQQSLVVRQLTRDFNLPIEIRVCPIVRESDGLALSSRNVYLSPPQRRQALVLNRALLLAAELALAGERSAAAVLAQVEKLFDAEPGVRLDYFALADPETLAPVERLEGTILAAVAAFVGSTRLIDNRLIELPS